MADGIVWDDERTEGIAWDEPQPQKPTQPTISAPRAGVLGFAQGGTFGFADEIGGLLGKFLVGDGVQIAEPSAQDSPEIRAMKERAMAEQRSGYEIVRDLMRKERQQAQEQRPGAYIAGEVGGGIATALLPGGAGGQAARGGTLAARAGRAALAGAGAGATYGLGASEADILKGDVGGAAKDVVAGGTLGAAGGVAGEGLVAAGQKLLPKAEQAIADLLSDFAEKRALKAAGYNYNDIKPFIRSDPERVSEMGSRLLSEDGLITPFARIDTISQRLDEAVERYGQGIGRVLEAADQMGGRFDMNRFTERARRELLEPLQVGPQGQFDPSKRRKAEALQRLIEEYEALAGQPALLAQGQQAKPVGFAIANRLKSNLQDEINFGNRWSNTAPDHQEFLKRLQSILLDEVDTQLEEQFGRVVPDIGRDFKELKARYGLMLDASDKARMEMGRQNFNDFFSMKDMQVGGAIAGGGVTPSLLFGSPEAAAMSIAAGGLAALATKVLRERGASASAVAANRLAGVMQRQWLSSLPLLVQRAPQLLGRYGGVLAKELQTNGMDGLLAVDAALSAEDPEYAQTKSAIVEEMMRQMGGAQ